MDGACKDVIVLDESHLCRILARHVEYYNNVRSHFLAKKHAVTMRGRATIRRRSNLYPDG